MTQNKLIETIIRAVPYSSQIKDIDLTQGEAVRFTWRGNRYRVTETGAETVENGCLVSGDLAILMETLIKREMLTQKLV